uniref:ARAD1D05456p n=1 Tax=Blastobotrys adeninivorans TaxID=409370 RepID=A0A060TE98_BLAAD
MSTGCKLEAVPTGRKFIQDTGDTGIVTGPPIGQVGHLVLQYSWVPFATALVLDRLVVIRWSLIINKYIS